MNQDTIALLKDGDQGVFNSIVNEYQNMVYNTAINIVQNESDAEDITQEVFIQLHQSIADFREEAILSTWLYRITINKALDHEKKRKRMKRGGSLRSLFIPESQEDPVHFNHPGVLTENREKAAILHLALKKIPETQRIAFILNKMEGRSYQEVADITDSTRMAVESLLFRAKNNLRKFLKIYYEENIK